MLKVAGICFDLEFLFLSRYQNVGFLDTDVGQPELTPPGLLSFHLLDKPIAGMYISQHIDHFVGGLKCLIVKKLVHTLCFSQHGKNNKT